MSEEEIDVRIKRAAVEGVQSTLTDTLAMLKSGDTLENMIEATEHMLGIVTNVLEATKID